MRTLTQTCGPLILCDLAGSFIKRVLSQIFPSKNPVEYRPQLRRNRPRDEDITLRNSSFFKITQNVGEPSATVFISKYLRDASNRYPGA